MDHLSPKHDQGQDVDLYEEGSTLSFPLNVHDEVKEH